GFRRDELIARLPAAGKAELSTAILLAFEHAPEHVLPLVRKGLSADVPIDRTETAAILTLIDAPWSRRELLSALAASDDQLKTVDIRAALLESRDRGLEQAVCEWERCNPHEATTGNFLEVDGRTIGPF